MPLVKRIALRNARRNRGLTQQDLERLSGVSQGVISRIECGVVTDPNFSTVVQLAAALDLDPRVLRFGPKEGAA